jgi:NAD(P)-dependent dehydrogenase (short-subunit alcohol dehydrogenase family)
MNISGKVALVTGAGTGIGRATAVRLAALGAMVVCVDISSDAEETVEAIEKAGGKAVAHRADVSNPDAVADMIAFAELAYGGLDICFNNAGVIGGEPIWPESPLHRIARVIAVNLGGVAMGTEEAIRAMRRRGGGVIINTASTAALRPMPTDPVYSATKVAVVRIVESCVGFASEGIRVNAVLPSMVETDMTMKHTGDGTRPAAWLAPALAVTKMLQPDDIAAAVIALIEDDSAVGECRVVPNAT